MIERSGLPERCGLAERDQLLGITARVEPVGHVAALRQTRQRHDADAGGDAVQVRRDLLGMAAAGVVVVRQDVDVRALEVRVQLGRPLVGAAGVAGGDEAEAREAIDVLLAFDDEDGIIGSVGPQLEQPIGHLADALDPPGPASLAVRTALTEVLRLVADDLEEQLSGLVAVIVGGDDPPPLLWLALRLDRNAEFRDEPFGRLAVGQTGVPPDEVDGAAADLVLMVVPLAALVAGDLDGERSVACRSAAARASTARGSARRAGRAPRPRSAR